jgi:hypothetical protein
MSATDIFFIGGELNWDAINTISNVLLVAALVVITAFYAGEVRKQTNLMVKDQKRNRILEEIRDFSLYRNLLLGHMTSSSQHT